MKSHDSALAYEALLHAQRLVGPVEALESSEVLSASGRPREVLYPSAEAVTSAARRALNRSGLVLLLRDVGAATQGLTGPELPLVFELVHIESSEVIVREMRWPIADAADFLGRPQALAATIATARKHLQMDLLAIEVVRRTKAERAAESAGAAPSWMELGADPRPAQRHDVAVTRGPVEEQEAPADAGPALMVWQRAEYRRRVEAERARGGTGGGAVFPGWQDAVAAALGGAPRAAGEREVERVCGFLRVHAQAADAQVVR